MNNHKKTRNHKRQPVLPSVNGSALGALDKCPLSRKTPFGITDVRMTQFSIARFYGGITFNDKQYTYLQNTDELIRDDVLLWRLKQLKSADAKPTRKRVK